MSFDSVLRRLLHPPNRPPKHARDMAIFRLVERLKWEGCTWEGAYSRAVIEGGFEGIGSDQVETLKTAYNRMKRRLRRASKLYDLEATLAMERAERERFEAMVQAALSRDRTRLMTLERHD